MFDNSDVWMPFFTFCSIDGPILLDGLQDLSPHILQAPGRLLVLQQDHVDCDPVHALTGILTTTCRNPEGDQHGQPQVKRAHCQLWISELWWVHLRALLYSQNPQSLCICTAGKHQVLPLMCSEGKSLTNPDVFVPELPFWLWAPFLVDVLIYNL